MFAEKQNTSYTRYNAYESFQVPIKQRHLCNAFINSQFYYAPLIWMFAGKLLISRVQKIHFRSLQKVYNTYDITYNELLSTNSDVSIHQRHLRFLVT